LRWRIFDALPQNRFGGAGEFRDGGLAHCLQDLEQAPSLIVVPFRRQNSFAFEIDVIDKGICSCRRRAKIVEAPCNLVPLCGGCVREHFRERILQALDHKLRLQIDGISEKPAQLLHLATVLGIEKLSARFPGAGQLVRREEERGKFGSVA
jgi:hypothetical protein